MGKKPFNNTDLNDEDFLDALSKVGVFITDYETGECLTSRMWKEIPDIFSPGDEKQSYLTHLHPDDRERVARSLEDLFYGRIGNFNEIYRLRREDGRYRWVLSVGQTVKTRDGQKPALFVGADSDITELKETEEKLRESVELERQRTRELEKLRQIVSEISGSLDTEETIKNILKHLKRVIPYESGSIQLLKENFLCIEGTEGFDDIPDIRELRFKFPSPDSLSTRAIQENRPFLANDVPRDFPAFTQPRENKIILSWLGIPLVSHGSVIGLVSMDGYEKNMFSPHHLEIAGIIGDHISIAMENAMLHEQAFKLAMEDPLTCIGSRRRMDMEGRLMFDTALRNGTEISFVMMDIDHFKSINDKYGHNMGDVVLKNIAAACREEVRSTDLLARFGGEEFILIMASTNETMTLAAVERIREKIASLNHDPIGEKITISAGIYSSIPREEDQMKIFIKKADEALYRAKENGRNRTELG